MWTAEHHAKSIEGGWKLVTTFENGDTTPLYDIVDYGPKFRDAKHASEAVIDAAKRGGVIHQQALRLVLESRRRPATNPKGKK